MTKNFFKFSSSTFRTLVLLVKSDDVLGHIYAEIWKIPECPLSYYALSTEEESWATNGRRFRKKGASCFRQNALGGLSASGPTETLK